MVECIGESFRASRAMLECSRVKESQVEPSRAMLECSIVK